MKNDLTDVLDIALAELQTGERVADLLDRHATAQPALAELLGAAAALEPLRAVEMPTPERRAHDRNQFLSEATRTARQSVSAGPLVRVKEWFAHLFAWQVAAGPILQREPRRMNALMLKFVLVVAMLFGSAGGTAVAAANSLPGSPLYPAKMAMEQARLQVAADPSDQAQLHMILAQLRTKEIEKLALKGTEPGQAVLQQLQQHVNYALQLAAGMPDEEMQGTLAAWQQEIQQRERALQQAQLRVAEPAQEPLRQALQILQQTQQQLQAGQENGQAFRWQHALGLEPDDAVDAAAGDCEDCEPVGDEFKYQRGPDAGQPSPGEPGGNQYRNCTDCDPDGDQSQYGPGPDQPGPGEPGGNTTAPCVDCGGEQHQYGPGPDQPGPGQPGGNPTAPCDDCDGDGEQSQYGPGPEQPGPGEPGGAVDPPCDGCEGDGEQHQRGEPPAEPGPADDSGSGGDTGAGGEQTGDTGGTDTGGSQSGDTGSGDTGGSGTGGSTGGKSR